MATSSSKDEPTKPEAFKNNIAPPTKPAAKTEAKQDTRDALDHDANGKTGGAAKPKAKAEQAPPAPSAEELAKREAQRVEEERQRVEAETKASLKGSAVDGLNLPEKQGEVLWQTGFNVGERQAGEKDKDFEQRWTDAENVIVSQAMNVMSGPGGIRANGYQLVRDESAGILRLNLVSADPEYPDPKRVGGLPNAEGTY